MTATKKRTKTKAKKSAKTVAEYIAKQPSPQKEICKKLQKIIKKIIPGIKEEMKLGVPFYEGKFYIVSLKDSVNLGVSVQGLSKEQKEKFKGKGKYMQHLKYKEIKDIDEKEVVKLLKMVWKDTVKYNC